MFKLFKKKKEDNVPITGNPVVDGSIKENISAGEYMKIHNVNTLGESLDKLIDGELPFGWVAHYKEFTDKVQAEYNTFLEAWWAVSGKHPRQEYAALKSLVIYHEDIQKLCCKKGECFEFWCKEILIGKNMYDKRKDDLAKLESNLEALVEEYEGKQEVENSITSDGLLKLIEEKQPILQKDLYKLFDNPYAKAVISDKLYWLDKEGKIKRTKAGNTYSLERAK